MSCVGRKRAAGRRETEPLRRYVIVVRTLSRWFAFKQPEAGNVRLLHRDNEERGGSFRGPWGGLTKILSVHTRTQSTAAACGTGRWHRTQNSVLGTSPSRGRRLS